MSLAKQLTEQIMKSPRWVAGDIAGAIEETLSRVLELPLLGNATTGDLLNEIKARVDLEYRTVGGKLRPLNSDFSIGETVEVLRCEHNAVATGSHVTINEILKDGIWAGVNIDGKGPILVYLNHDDYCKAK